MLLFSDIAKLQTYATFFSYSVFPIDFSVFFPGSIKQKKTVKAVNTGMGVLRFSKEFNLHLKLDLLIDWEFILLLTVLVS